ncbi:hypothetical protein PAMC26510_06050 [Caballeronia sordidicola]|uniref:Uncharacterized protein n=1 Tax=Caballeronia sordidicola TaxID=196367 RepID=A0A242N6N6_CABSO|nr:hypothetical protein PAMC26510_06050 [Caballeronia sordidicola]
MAQETFKLHQGDQAAARGYCGCGIHRLPVWMLNWRPEAFRGKARR